MSQAQVVVDVGGYYTAVTSDNRVFVTQQTSSITGHGLDGGAAAYTITPMCNGRQTDYILSMAFDSYDRLFYYDNNGNLCMLAGNQIATSGTPVATSFATGLSDLYAFHSTFVYNSRFYFGVSQDTRFWRMGLDGSGAEQYNVDVSDVSSYPYLKGFGPDRTTTYGGLVMAYGSGNQKVSRVTLYDFVTTGIYSGDVVTSSAITTQPTVTPSTSTTFTITCTGSTSGDSTHFFAFTTTAAQSWSFTSSGTESVRCVSGPVTGDVRFAKPVTLLFTTMPPPVPPVTLVVSAPMTAIVPSIAARPLTVTVALDAVSAPLLRGDTSSVKVTCSHGRVTCNGLHTAVSNDCATPKTCSYTFTALAADLQPGASFTYSYVPNDVRGVIDACTYQVSGTGSGVTTSINSVTTSIYLGAASVITISGVPSGRCCAQDAADVRSHLRRRVGAANAESGHHRRVHGFGLLFHLRLIDRDNHTAAADLIGANLHAKDDAIRR